MIPELYLKTYFQNFGEVEEVVAKFDPKTGQFRHFYYVLFKDVESARDVVEIS